MSHLEPGTPINEYLIQEILQEGSCGNVYGGIAADNTRVVLKFTPLTNSWFAKQYRQEVSMLKKFRNSPQIVSLRDHFKYGSSGVIVLERLDKDLLDHIESTPIPIKDVKKIFKTICFAIRELHHNNTAHLDIKPENIFLNSVDEVKLGDFGSCFQTESDGRAIGVTGTKMYCAPEVSHSHYRATNADIWSLGILLHVLVTGYWPFSGDTEQELHKHIEKGTTTLLVKKLPNDMELLSLLDEMLKLDPLFRLTIDEVLEHPFLYDKSAQVFTWKRVRTEKSGKPRIGSHSNPEIADLSLLPTQQMPTKCESEANEDYIICSPRAPTGKQKRNRRESWTPKHFLNRLSKLVK